MGQFIYSLHIKTFYHDFVEAINLANIDQDLYLHIASLGICQIILS